MKIRRRIARKYHQLILQSSWYLQEMFPDCQKFWNGFPMGLDVVNLGSRSAWYAFNYEGIDKQCANWAMRPQSLFADLLILQNYVSYLKPGTIVLISICPFSSLSSPRYVKSDKYYTVLGSKSIWPFDIQKYNLMNDIKNNPKRYYPVRALKEDLKNILLHKKIEEHSFSSNEYEEHAVNMINGWMQQFSILNFDYPLRIHNIDMYDTAVDILREMIGFCIERELRPVIVVPPVTTHLSSRMSMSVREKYMYSFIKKADTANVPCLDYFDNDRFQSDDLFRDSLCLNEKGAILFTKQVLKDVGLEK